MARAEGTQYLFNSAGRWIAFRRGRYVFKLRGGRGSVGFRGTRLMSSVEMASISGRISSAPNRLYRVNAQPYRGYPQAIPGYPGLSGLSGLSRLRGILRAPSRNIGRGTRGRLSGSLHALVYCSSQTETRVPARCALDTPSSGRVSRVLLRRV